MYIFEVCMYACKIFTKYELEHDTLEQIYFNAALAVLPEIKLMVYIVHRMNSVIIDIIIVVVGDIPVRI